MDQLSIILTGSIILLTALSGLIFAFAEGSPLAAMTLPVGLCTWVLIYRTRRFHVPSAVHGILGGMAILASLLELYFGGIESRLLAGGHLLVYLACIFLLNLDNPNSVWWLTALSVLQVAVASLLTSEQWFGGALVIWLLTTMWTMALLTMQRSVARAVGGLVTAHGPVGQFDIPTLGSVSSEVTGRSYSINGLRPDERFRLLSGRYVTWVGLITVAAILMSVLFFLLIPRVWMSRMRLFDDTILAGRRMDGFTERVRLGDIGEIMANNEVAMKVNLSDFPGQKHWSRSRTEAWLGDSPLFRARTLETYQNSEWKPSRASTATDICQAPAPTQKLVRIEIQLMSTGTSSLFTTGQVVTCQSQWPTTDLRYRRMTNEYFRQDMSFLDSFSYHVFSLPEPEELEFDWRFPVGRWNLNLNLGNSLEYDEDVKAIPDNIPNLRRITREVLRTLPDNADAELRSRTLLSYLRDSGNFEYTLKQSITDRKLDPVDDFILNRRKGHCELFASAYALMLREAGIPSRIVTGFKGGKFDKDSATLLVHGRHAHAWVEARLFNRWVTLDPTPAIRDTEVETTEQAKESVLKNLKDLMSRLWLNGISMNSHQQQEQIYRPMQQLGTRVLARLQQFWEQMRGLFSDVLKTIRDPSQWFSWRGGLTAFGLLVSLALIIRGIMLLISKLRAQSDDEDHLERNPNQISFFERYKHLLRKEGLVPQRSQTASEFSTSAANSLQSQLDVAGLTTLPDQIVDQFYRVRFGDKTLTSQETTQLDQRLEKLEACLSRRRDVNS